MILIIFHDKEDKYIIISIMSSKEVKHINPFDLLLDSSDDESNDSKSVFSESDDDDVKTNKKYIPPKKNIISDMEIKEKEHIRKEIDETLGEDIYVPPSNLSWNTVAKKKREVNDMESYDEKEEYEGDDLELNDTWILYTHSNNNSDWSITSYDPIMEIKNVGSLWRLLNVVENLKKDEYQYFIMRHNITPIWEDNKNKKGGICSIAVENKYIKNHGSNIGTCAFNAICMLVLNETFVANNNDINGISLSIKSKKSLIKLWVSDYKKNENFTDYLPLTLLKKIEDIITNSSYRGRNDNRMAVSVQYKEIIPDY